jgi:hypothetical protein
MKTLYTVNARFMNGTVAMMTDTSSYLNEDLAKKVGEKIKEKNPQYKIIVEVIETELFEDESEVPILNNEEA